MTEAIASVVSRHLNDAIANSDAIEQVLPSALAPVAPFLERGLAGVIEQQTEALLSSGRGHEFIVRAVHAAHVAIMRILESEPPESGLVVVEDGKVSLNFVPVINAVLARIQGFGILDEVELTDLRRLDDARRTRSPRSTTCCAPTCRTTSAR